jgi:ABC-type transport system involved in multi-copper enzyme maturation permease subunit
VDLTSFKNNFELFKAELKKAWGFPILELAVGFVALVSIPTINPLLEAYLPSGFQASFTSLVAQTFTMNINAQMLPLTILCGILVSLSFARDYEQGLMQTLLSSPLPRSSVFIIKFLAVVIPLTLVSWAVTLLLLVLNFYADAAAVFTVIQITAWALPMTLLGFFFWFITTLKAESIGDIANYLALTPYKTPLAALSRIFDVQMMPPAPPEALENILPAWNFIALTVFYALVLVIPMYLYFTRRFEIRE